MAPEVGFTTPWDNFIVTPRTFGTVVKKPAKSRKTKTIEPVFGAGSKPIFMTTIE